MQSRAAMVECACAGATVAAGQADVAAAVCAHGVERRGAHALRVLLADDLLFGRLPDKYQRQVETGCAWVLCMLEDAATYRRSVFGNYCKLCRTFAFPLDSLSIRMCHAY